MILFNKKNDFIKNYSRSRSLDNILILEKSKPYHVTPEITNPLNVFSLWKEVNYLISSVGSRSDGLYIEIEDCRDEIEKIKEEIHLKDNPDGLLIGL